MTLEKGAKDYSPTTLYNDYALSPTCFNRESQSNCHDETGTGHRYTQATHGKPQRVLLFVRARKNDERGETVPYTLLKRAGMYRETKVAAG